MTLSVRYEYLQDRMRLEIRPAGQEAQSFLLNRRQWLNLIRAVGVGELAPQTVPPQRPEANKDDNEALVQEVKAVRIKREQAGLRVVFQLEGAEAGVLLPDEGLPEIGELFFRQAERAGWDPAAGLERLKAAALAQETLRKAQATEKP